MLFNSLEFLVFLPIVLVVYYALAHRAQNIWLLLASYGFYGAWDYRFLSLIAISTVVDYFVALAISESNDESRRKRFLLLSLFTNLGILGFFKYFDFFIGSLAELLATIGFQVHMPTLRIVLPVGISFYTFQTLSYTIDVYRRQMEPTRDFGSFALFVAYFPQLVAGPIERARNLLPRIEAPRVVSWPAIGIGVELILIGFLKKVGIADSLAPLVDTRFLYPSKASGADLLVAGYLFAFQIYCDFSGYSDIARGVSKLFGVDLMRNFEQPYLSRSITEFWRRLHISLSTWLRDYLYIPLGGNRHGVRQTYRNLMLTMLLGGLWHGAAWTFVVWGGLHGLYLSLHKLMISRTNIRLPALLGGLLTFHAVVLSWIFFRSPDFAHAWDFLMGILTWQPATAEVSPLDWTSPRLIILLASIILIDSLQRRSGRHAVFIDWPWWLRGFSYATLVIIILTLGGFGGQVPFIYFQF